MADEVGIHGDESEQVKELRSWLNSRMRLTITDGRILVGNFTCIDRQSNTILSATDEYRDGASRHVGMIIVPGRHIVRAEIENVNID